MSMDWKRPRGAWTDVHRVPIRRHHKNQVQKQIDELKSRGYYVLTVPEIREEITLGGRLFYVALLEKKTLSQ
jgi:hypothetical protein